MKTIKEYAADFFSPCISERMNRCWQCKHFRRNSGKGVNGCDIDPASFDNGWEYIPAKYRANDHACGYFELKQEIKEHLNRVYKKQIN